MGRKTTRNTNVTSSSNTSGGATATAPRPASTPQQAAPSVKPQAAVVTKPATPARAPAITHEQIAQRAREIWTKRGCKVGQDEQNWLEAEAQLKAELAAKSR